MLIRDWMTKEVITVSPGVSMMKASRLMREHKVHRLPVVGEDGSLVGIISDRDIKDASPSKATTLDMHELYYLLAEIKVQEIMTRQPVSMRGDDSVEQAALVMVERHFGGIPVVDEADKVVGIITESDIFKVFINLTGALSGGLQLAFELSPSGGGLREVLNALREHEGRVVSVLTAQKDEENRMVYIRVGDLDTAAQKALIADMRERFNLLYWHPRA